MASVNSTSNSSSTGGTYSTRLRITGAASGLDVDGTVKKLMEAESLKLTKLNQTRQYTQWRQDGLRDIIKDFRDFRQSYLLYESPSDTNMIKSQGYSGSVVNAVDSDSTTGVASSSLTATALPGAVNGTSTIKVTQMAKSAKIEGSSFKIFNIDNTPSCTDWQNKTLSFSVNGSTPVTFTLPTTIASDADLQTSIKNAIDGNSTLKGKLSASVSDGKVSFDALSSDSVKLTVDSKTMELNSSTSTKLSDLGVTTDLSFKITQSGNTSSTIAVKSSDTIQDLINAINNAQSQDGVSTSGSLYANLQVGFSELTKSLTIQTRNTGSSQSLTITPISGDITQLGLTTTETQKSQDAIVEITPAGSLTSTTVTKSSNNFTIDNMTYNILKDPGATPYTVNLTTKADSQDAVKKIKGFIEKYNALVDKINTKITEKKLYDYKPLTDDQKSSMTETQIKAWEDKSKQGILKNDGDLQGILDNMRNAFMSSVKSAGISLKEIGIDTYSGLESVSKPGQLKVDDAKLKAALENRGDQVMKIFTVKPDKTITDTKEKYNNTGIFQRIEDIINNAAVKFDGDLLKKAGYAGTASDLTNLITKDLNDQDTAIYNMKKKLADKEEAYYKKFSALETAMTKLNAQQASLSQQFGN